MPAFLINKPYADALSQIFALRDDGHITIGAAESISVHTSLEALQSPVMFRDYIMEGGIRYSLAAVPVDEKVRIEIGLSGMNRDAYVVPTIRDYLVNWVGLGRSAVADA